MNLYPSLVTSTVYHPQIPEFIIKMIDINKRDSEILKQQPDNVAIKAKIKAQKVVINSIYGFKSKSTTL